MPIPALRMLRSVFLAGALCLGAGSHAAAQDTGGNPATPGAPAGPATPAPSGGNVQTTPAQPNAPATPNQPAVTPGPVTPGAGNAGPGASVPVAGAAPQVFDLSQTLEAALQSSAALQIAARNVEIDRRRADEAAAAGRPNITGDASATRLDAPTVVHFQSDAPPITVAKEHNEILSLGVTQRLDFTGQIRAAVNRARLESLADTFTLQQVRNERLLAAQDVYFNLLRAQHRVEVARAALAAAQAQQQTAQTLYQNQVGQKIDLLRANTEVASALQELTRTENELAVARSRFNDLVGRPLDAPVEAVDVPGVTVGTDVVNTSAVGAPAPRAFTPYTVPPAELAGIDLERSIEAAGRQRPEILAAEVEVRVAETGIKIARAGREPQFALRASGNYYPTTSFQFPRERTAGITATVSLPLYDGGATRDRVERARLETENARTNLASRRTGVALEVRRAYLNLITAARQIEAANAALEQAVAARQLAQIRYEGQVGLYLEVTDAQSALVRAQNNQVNAVYDYLLARAALENAVGAPRIR